MKLSEAMEAGKATGFPHSQGRYFDTDDQDKPCSACAMGLAMLGVCNGDMELTTRRFNQFLMTTSGFPELELAFDKISNPFPGAFKTEEVMVEEIIIYLNDEKGWTIDQIIDWVKQKEMECVNS